MPISPLRNKVKTALQELKDLQEGKSFLVKTTRPHIDSTLGGLLPGDVVVIAGASGAGKTFELQALRESIMNTDNNPLAEEFLFVDFSFDMKLFNLVLRGLSSHLNKSKKDILFNKFSEKELPLVRRYVNTFYDNRFFIEETPLTGEQFYNNLREFCLANSNKKAIFVSVDHMALFKKDNNSTQGSIETVMDYINLLKKEFNNIYFILLTQLNRGILLRINERDVKSTPNRADVYQSDTIFHLADYLYVVHNPFRLGITEYSKVSKKIYEYLSEFFTDTSELNKKSSFNTTGNIFYHVLKVREEDVVFRDLYIEKIISENLKLYEQEAIEVIEDKRDLDFSDELETEEY